MARRRGYDYYYEYFPPSKPREAKGGIKAQSKRGQFGESWWAKRWIAVLESFNLGGRLTRGRSYARRGQVTSIDIDKGTVKAKVQGSRSTPYSVTINIKTLSSKDWDRLAKSLSEQALFAARLLAGEMPEEIEDAFKEAQLSLFPQKLGDLKTDCSCPDWSNPCKHIAAVYYLIGEEFDRDPFLLFKLRGATREELIAKLKKSGATEQPALPEAPPALSPEPLPDDPGLFWNGADLPPDFFGEIQRPPVAAAVPRRLGGFPFWRGQEHFLDALEPIYTAASDAGLQAYVGEL